MARLYGFVLELINPSWDVWLIGESFTLSNLAGLLTGVATAVGLRLSSRVTTLGTEIGNELAKVSWPTWKETRLSTIVVVVTSVIVSLILGFFDFVWLKVTQMIYGL